MMRHWALASLAMGLLTLPAAAQDVAAQRQIDLDRFERQLDQMYLETRLQIDTDVPINQRVLVDYGGLLGFSFMAIDDATGSTHILRLTELTGYGRVNIDGVHDFFVRARAAYYDFNSGDDFDGNGDDFDTRLDRAHYRFDLARYLMAYEGRRIGGNVIVQGGRQLVHWANGLTLSQVLDGGVITLACDDLKASIDIVAGVTTNDYADLDPARPDFDDDVDRGFYGAKIDYQLRPRHRVFVYGLVQDDDNKDARLLTDIDGDGILEVTRFRYHSHYIGLGGSGSIGDRWLYAVEAVYQGGETRSTSFRGDRGGGAELAQGKDDIHAWAADGRVDYLLHDANNTRFTGELLIASGDSDRSLFTHSALGGNKRGTNDLAFNGFGLINTGLAFAPQPSNLVMLRGGASTFPLVNSKLFRRLQTGVDLFLFGKYTSHGPIDEDSTDGFFLGFEADFFANWQITSDLSLGLRYGFFVPGDPIGGRLTDGDADIRHFFYSGLTFAF